MVNHDAANHEYSPFSLKEDTRSSMENRILMKSYVNIFVYRGRRTSPVKQTVTTVLQPENAAGPFRPTSPRAGIRCCARSLGALPCGGAEPRQVDR